MPGFEKPLTARSQLTHDLDCHPSWEPLILAVMDRDGCDAREALSRAIYENATQGYGAVSPPNEDQKRKIKALIERGRVREER